MRALVLGGGGHIGSAFVRRLASAGCDTVAAGRRPQPPASLMGAGATYQQVGEQLQGGELRGYDLIVDAAAPYALETVDRDAALRRGQTIVDACAQTGARLVHVGSFTTLVPPDTLVARGLSSMHPYFDLKAALQAQVLAAPVSAVIVNPTQCLGPWDMRPLRYALLPLLVRGEVPFSSNHRINIIDVRDVATLALRALERERYGEPLLLAGHNTTLDTLFERVAALGDSSPPFWRASAYAGALTLFAMEKLAGLVGQKPLYPSLGVVLLLCQQWLFANRAQRELRVPLACMSKTLRDALKWYAGREHLRDALEPARSVGL
jgi:nucleoside-diphosphate-sugar epimerase